MRPKRKTNPNIVIICEGTETEESYFSDLKEYITQNVDTIYSDIRIVPTKKEMIINTKPQGRRQRQFVTGDKSNYRYYYQTEEKEEDYNQYKAQPTRYVREAQLFIKNDGYSEAWAVFDNDKFPCRKEAFDLADSCPNLWIAYSSISFEEWLLLHFNRDSNKYECSECKCDKGKSLGCDSNKGCKGNRCIAGRLRAESYIQNYSKSQGVFYHILDRLEQARINAAWIRHQNAMPIYEANPFTNVDELVNRLLGYDSKYVWITLGDKFEFDGTILQLTRSGDTYLLHNIGKNSVIINHTNLRSTDLEGASQKIISGILEPNKCAEWDLNSIPYNFLRFSTKNRIVLLNR